MNKEKLKEIKKKSRILSLCYDIVRSFHGWILNYIIAIIPFWCIRKFFYVISGMKLGKGVRIGLFTKVIRPERIVIGDRTVVNEYCYLDGRGGLTIGFDSSVSIYTKIITATHRINSEDFEYMENSTYIGNHVWIGCDAIILDNSNIADGCVIGAGSVFKGTAKSNSVYSGNPAQYIKERKSELHYQIDFHPFFR